VGDDENLAGDESSMALLTCHLGEPTILEPIMKVEIDVPTEFKGAVVGQVNQRRGVILETVAGLVQRGGPWGAFPHILNVTCRAANPWRARTLRFVNLLFWTVEHLCC
jgi:hypothetical protein